MDINRGVGVCLPPDINKVTRYSFVFEAAAASIQGILDHNDIVSYFIIYIISKILDLDII